MHWLHALRTVAHAYFLHTNTTGDNSMASVSLRKFLGGLALTAVSFATFSSTASAQALEAIKARGKVIIGVQADNPNWGFVDIKNEYQGVDPDVARLVGKELGVPVEFIPVTNNNRIAALQTGRVDVLISSMGMLPERAKQVQFSQPYAPNLTILIAAKTTAVANMADLAKVKVGVPRGSSSDVQISKEAPAGTNILRLEDDAATIQALLSGQVQAAGGNLFYIGRINQSQPGVFENKFVLKALYQGAASRQGDKAWNAYLNTVIEKARTSGALAQIFKKWTGQDMTELPKSIPDVPFTAP
jgi:polar amino acid transport system substrate-binding protein